MMDYMSNFPAPSREESINEIKIHIKKIPNFKNISDEYITKLVTKQFDIVTNYGKFRGSAAGWVVFEQPEIIKNVKLNLNILTFKKYRFKAIVKTLVYLNEIFKDHLNKYYAPGAKGMTDAYLEFEEYKNIIHK